MKEAKWNKYENRDNPDLNDVVYILGSGSKFGDAEIVLSLRSVEKHLINYGNIHVFGADVSKMFKSPEDKSHLIFNHVIQEKPYSVYRQQKKLDLVMAACESKGVSDDFILFSDDYFLTKDVDAVRSPYYAHKHSLDMELTLRESKKKGPVRQKVEADTTKALNTNVNPDYFVSAKNFSTFTPMRINKKKFKTVINFCLKGQTPRYGVDFKSIYANSIIDPTRTSEGNDVEGWDVVEKPHFPVEITKDLFKIDGGFENDAFELAITRNDSFSVSDKRMTMDMAKVISSKYPNKSRWEK